MFYYENGEMVTYWNSLIFRGSPLESGGEWQCDASYEYSLSTSKRASRNQLTIVGNPKTF